MNSGMVLSSYDQLLCPTLRCLRELHSIDAVLDILGQRKKRENSLFLVQAKSDQS